MLFRYMRAFGATLLLVVFLSVAYEQDHCIDCPPRLPISASTIALLDEGLADGSVANDFAFHHNSQLLVVITRGDLYRLQSWSIRTPDEFTAFWDIDSSLNINDSLRHVASSQISDLIAVGENSGVITFWNIKQRSVESLVLWHDTAISYVVFHPQEDKLAAIGDQQQIRVYTLETHIPQRIELPSDVEYISNVSFNADGTLLVAGADEIVALWDGSDFEPIGTYSVTDETLQLVLFHPQKTDILFTLVGTEVKRWQWDGTSLDEQIIFRIPQIDGVEPSVTASALSADGSVLIAIYNQREIAVWNTDTGELIDVPALRIWPSEIDPRDIYSVSFSPDGMWLILGTGVGLVFHNIP